MSSRVSVDVRGRARRKLPEPVRREVARQLARAMRAAGAHGEVALSFTDDVEMRRINHAFAGEDHATDVLSFSQEEGEVVVATALLGDVVVSVETAARQADAGGRTLTAELVHLAVHGLAHLCGYDHATPADERVMFGFEARLRARAAGRAAVTRVRRPRR